MTSFLVVHSKANDWNQAAKICADECCNSEDTYTLGFIYVTDNLAKDLNSILAYLRRNRHKTLGW